jgi:hypothetical protein
MCVCLSALSEMRFGYNDVIGMKGELSFFKWGFDQGGWQVSNYAI